MDLASILELAKLIGFPAIIVWMWWITQQTFRDNLSAMQQQHKTDFEFLNNQHKEDFAVLNEFAEAIRLTGGQLMKLNENIRTNQFCPTVRQNSQGH